MNAKAVKKLRQAIRKEQVGSFNEFAETIDSAPFRLRIKIAIKIIFKKL